MAKDDTKTYSRSGLAAMKARGEVRATPTDAPEIELDEAFWDQARIVETRPRRKTSVHLRLDSDTLDFYRSHIGPSISIGHAGSMINFTGPNENLGGVQHR